MVKITQGGLISALLPLFLSIQNDTQADFTLLSSTSMSQTAAEHNRCGEQDAGICWVWG